MAANRFKKGSGCYRCESCRRLTRNTRGEGSNSMRLCYECYDLQGIENQMSDNGSTPELEAEAEALRSRIAELGGNI